MKKLENIAELNSLEIGEKFYVISEGNLRWYYYNGINCKTKCPIGVWDANHMELKSFSTQIKFQEDKFMILIGPYNSKIIGEIKIKQHKRQIKAIEEVYLKQ